MGVELRHMQRKFHTLMGEMKPQIRPRFVVWLDDRLAEFKVKGSMELCETLEDPQWIKDYYTSKRESKAAAIKEREARDAGSTTGSVHPKVEAKSESSNGVAHPDPEELDEGKEEKHERQEEEAAPPAVESEEQLQSQQPEQEFQLVEVKREQMEEEDDDMIIVGESIAPQTPQQPYPSQYNPTRQMYSGFGRNTGPFQRKRQRFGAMSQRPTMAMSAGSRFKSSRPKPNFRSASSSSAAHSSFASHPASSQSLYTSSQSSQLFHTDASSYAGDTHVTYDTGTADPQAFGTETSAYTGESLRIPPHLQAQAASLDLQQSEVPDYEVTESDMYSEEYGDESYDSSYLADTTDSSIIQYDEQGNVVIKGENPAGDDSMMEPTAGTSDGTSQVSPQGRTSYDASFKLMVAEYAKEKNNNRLTARVFEINEKLVRDWRRNLNEIRSMRSTKFANRGAPCQWPDLEKIVASWLKTEVKDGKRVTRQTVIKHAIQVAKQHKIANFRGSQKWCVRFLARHKIEKSQMNGK